MSHQLYFNQQRFEMKKFLPSDYLTVLELGCAAGEFKSNLKEGIEIWGVEPNNEFASLAASKGYIILNGLYECVENSLPNNYFDLIVCNDVIEHMPNHHQFLERIKLKLKQEGVFIGSIPNVRHVISLFEILIKKDFKYVDSGIFDKTHLRFFTEKSLKRDLSEHGYQINKFCGVHSAIKFELSLVKVIKSFLVIFLILLTFGFYWDIQYRQFGFNVSKALNKPQEIK